MRMSHAELLPSAVRQVRRIKEKAIAQKRGVLFAVSLFLTVPGFDARSSPLGPGVEEGPKPYTVCRNQSPSPPPLQLSCGSGVEEAVSCF